MRTAILKFWGPKPREIRGIKGISNNNYNYNNSLSIIGNKQFSPFCIVNKSNFFIVNSIFSSIKPKNSFFSPQLCLYSTQPKPFLKPKTNTPAKETTTTSTNNFQKQPPKLQQKPTTTTTPVNNFQKQPQKTTTMPSTKPTNNFQKQPQMPPQKPTETVTVNNFQKQPQKPTTTTATSAPTSSNNFQKQPQRQSMPISNQPANLNTKDENRLIEMIKKIQKARDFSTAEIEFDRIAKVKLPYNVYTFNTILYKASSTNELEQVEKYFARMRREKIRPDIVTITILIDSFGFSGNIEKAEFYFKKLQEYNIQPDLKILTAMIDVCSKFGNVKKAEEYYNQMINLNIEPNERTINLMIKCCLRTTNNTDSNEYTKNRLMKYFSILSNSKMEQSVDSYNAFIDSYGRMGDVEYSEQIYFRMLDLGMRPDYYTFLFLIRNCGETNDIKKAEKYLNDMRTKFRIKPTIFIYNILMFVCGNNYKRAFEFYKEMKEKGLTPDVATFNTLINSCIFEDFDLVDKLFNKMMEEEIKPDLITFTTVLNACAIHVRVDEAENYLRTMAKIGIPPSRAIYNTLINLFIAAGMNDKRLIVEEMMEKMEEKQTLLDLKHKREKISDKFSFK